MNESNRATELFGLGCLIDDLVNVVSEFADDNAREIIAEHQAEIESWIQKNVFVTPLAHETPPPHRTIITITLPIRLDYLGFITEFDDSDNFMVSVKDNLLVIEEVQS